MAYDGSIKIGTDIDTTGFADGRKQIESGMARIKNSVKSLASVIGLVFGRSARL